MAPRASHSSSIGSAGDSGTPSSWTRRAAGLATCSIVAVPRSAPRDSPPGDRRTAGAGGGARNAVCCRVSPGWGSCCSGLSSRRSWDGIARCSSRRGPRRVRGGGRGRRSGLGCLRGGARAARGSRAGAHGMGSHAARLDADGAGSAMSGAPGFAASGFFALRTPLLPARLADAWGVPPRSAIAAKLEEDAKVGGAETGGDLAAAIDEDRAHARAALLAWLDDRVAREALFLASPDLDASLPAWRASPDSERGQRIERSLGRYFLRMSGRATPFGLFSCCTRRDERRVGKEC